MQFFNLGSTTCELNGFEEEDYILLEVESAEVKRCGIDAILFDIRHMRVDEWTKENMRDALEGVKKRDLDLSGDFYYCAFLF